MIKALIFDLFGVIRPAAFAATYEKFGGDLEADADFIRQTFYEADRGRLVSFQAFADHLGITPEEWRREISNVQNDQRLLDYVAELRSTYKTGLLSNVGAGRIKELISAAEAARCFDVIIGSGDTGYAKPEPEIFALMTDKLDVPAADCLMIDDAQDNCSGAQAAGLAAIRYTSFDRLQKDFTRLLKKSAS